MSAFARSSHGLCRLCQAPLVPGSAAVVAQRHFASSTSAAAPHLAHARSRPSTSSITTTTTTSFAPRRRHSHGTLGLVRRIMIQARAPANPPEDFEPVPQEHAQMGLTDSAIKQLLRAQDKASDTSLALRVMVESGGCHGYQYKMQITSKQEPDDYVFQAPDSTAKLFVDAASLTLLSGSKIDYATELIGSSFRVVDNPHADHGAGCGCGVSWDLKPL
ncbi:hypothetical protein ACM66B_006292 [Microbotryomycetes sp. NB124-2]